MGAHGLPAAPLTLSHRPRGTGSDGVPQSPRPPGPRSLAARACVLADAPLGRPAAMPPPFLTPGLRERDGGNLVVSSRPVCGTAALGSPHPPRNSSGHVPSQMPTPLSNASSHRKPSLAALAPASSSAQHLPPGPTRLGRDLQPAGPAGRPWAAPDLGVRRGWRTTGREAGSGGRDTGPACSVAGSPWGRDPWSSCWDWTWGAGRRGAREPGKGCCTGAACGTGRGHAQSPPGLPAPLLPRVGLTPAGLRAQQVGVSAAQGGRCDPATLETRSMHRPEPPRRPAPGPGPPRAVLLVLSALLFISHSKPPF